MTVVDDWHELGGVDEMADPGCREFQIGDGDWPFRGFVVRKGEAVFAYRNQCAHVGHPLNWTPDNFLTKDRKAIICASHGAMFEIESGQCFRGPCVGKHLLAVPVRVQGGVVSVQLPS